MANINSKLYEVVNHQIDIIKYLYLKTINDYEINNAVKKNIHSHMISLSKEFYQHKSKLAKMDINQSNIDSFTKSETKYAKKLERELKSVLAKLRKEQTVKINIKKIITGRIDDKLGSDVIHKEFFLNGEIINHLNSFKEATPEPDRNLDSEMIRLKSKKYASDLERYPSRNIELLYRIILRIENQYIVTRTPSPCI